MKNKGWSAAVSAFNKIKGVQRLANGNIARAEYTKLKSSYTAYLKITEHSGFGSVSQPLDDSVWENLIRAHPGTAVFRAENDQVIPFIHYEQMNKFWMR